MVLEMSPMSIKFSQYFGVDGIENSIPCSVGMCKLDASDSTESYFYNEYINNHFIFCICFIPFCFTFIK